MSIRLQILAAALFALSVAAVLAAAAWEILRLVLEHVRRAGPPASRVRRWWRRGVLLAAAAGVLCILYGRFVEPLRPEVTRVRIESPKLGPGARPVRIVHLSDLHCDPAPRLEERLPGLVAAEQPDLVVFTGDCANSPEGVPLFRRTLAAVARVAPTFAVKGNWDAWYFPRIERFAGTGARELDGESVRVEVAGTPLRVAGAAFDREEGATAALGTGTPDEFTVFLYHTPDIVYDLAGRGADLLCAGHTHGGQVRLPLYGAIVTLSRFGKRFESGLHEVGGTRLYVNRGIGMEGGPAPRVRFLCRPEITVIEIAPPSR